MEQLCQLDLTMRDLAALTSDMLATICWLATYGLLANERQYGCQPGAQMHLQCQEGARFIDNWAWACKDCHAQLSIRKGSFFEASHLTLQQIVDYIYWWSVRAWFDEIQHQCRISSPNAVANWGNFCRDICAQYLLDHPVELGGPGRDVEVDESKFFHRKYHQGAYRKGHWVLRMVERGTQKCMMVVVEDRQAATLLPMIQRYILPGARIITDGWAAYNTLPNHASVNHRLHFVDPQNPTVHKNTIEGTWAHCKAQFRNMYRTSDGLFETHLQEFLWRRLYPRNVFGNFLYWVSHYYPL